jgi:hypothetical protein
MARLRGGGHVAEALPADDGQVALAFVGAVDTDSAGFVRAVRDPSALWRSKRIPHVARLSSPPRIEDFRELELSAADVEAIGHCRSGHCNVKLSSEEMRRLQRAPSVQQTFRQLMLERVTRYLSAGFRAETDYVDHHPSVSPRAVASTLLERSPWLLKAAPALAEYLEGFPRRDRGIESFLYWIETTYTPKPTIEIVHVTIQYGGDARATDTAAPPAVVAVSRLIFATHYINGSLSTSLLWEGERGSPAYVAYFTRAHVDGLDGWFGSVRRRLIERALRTRGAEAFDELRRRLSTRP